MVIESTPQQPNGDPAVLYSPAVGLADRQSKKPQPYPILKSPIRPEILYTDYRRRRHWMKDEDEDEDEDEYDSDPDEYDYDEEEAAEVAAEEEEMDGAEREKILATRNALYVDILRTDAEMLKTTADLCARARKNHVPRPPPLEMLEYPDLFERAWGWDMLLPRDFGYSWSRYKKYLAAYYDHNLNEASAAGNADDNGNDLASLAHSCIEMEGHLLFLWSKYAAEFPEHDRKIRRVSNKVTKCAQKIANVLKVESPAATLALKCITKESELICGWLTADKTSPISYIQTSNEIRQCALGFMVYKGPDYGVPMAAMMGVMKEAKVVRRFLWNIKEDNDHLDTSLRIRDRTAGVMFDICDEYFAAKDSTKGSTAGEFISIESDGKNLSEKKKELDEKDGRQETAKVDQNTKELDEKDGRQDTAKIDQNTKDYEEKEDIILDADDSIVNTYGSKQSTEVCSETRSVKRDDTMERNERQKLWRLLELGNNESNDGCKNTSEENESRKKDLRIFVHKKRRNWTAGCFPKLIGRRDNGAASTDAFA